MMTDKRITDRLVELQALAEQDSVPVDPASRADLLLLLNEPWVSARPCITLLDNGNFRALWQGPQGQQVGIQFLGHSIVQVVLFFRPYGRTFPSHLSGRCLFFDLPGLLSTLHLRDLLVDRTQSTETGLGAIIGQWPGDETEAQIADALERLS